MARNSYRLRDIQGAETDLDPKRVAPGMMAEIATWERDYHELWRWSDNPLTSRSDLWYAFHARWLKVTSTNGYRAWIPVIVCRDGIAHPIRRLIDDVSGIVPPELSNLTVIRSAGAVGASAAIEPIEAASLARTMNYWALAWMLNGTPDPRLPPADAILGLNNDTIALISFVASGRHAGLQADRDDRGVWRPLDDKRERTSLAVLYAHDSKRGSRKRAVFDASKFDRSTHTKAVAARQGKGSEVFTMVSGRSAYWRERYCGAVALMDGSVIEVLLDSNGIWRPAHETPRGLVPPPSHFPLALPPRIPSPSASLSRRTLFFLAGVGVVSIVGGRWLFDRKTDHVPPQAPRGFGGVLTTPGVSYNGVDATVAVGASLTVANRSFPVSTNVIGRYGVVGLRDPATGWIAYAGIARIKSEPGLVRIVIEVPPGTVGFVQADEVVGFAVGGAEVVMGNRPRVVHRDGRMTTWGDAPDAPPSLQHGSSNPYVACLFIEGGQWVLPLNLNPYPANSHGTVVITATQVNIAIVAASGILSVDVTLPNLPGSSGPNLSIAHTDILLPCGIVPTQALIGARPVQGSHLQDGIEIWQPHVYPSDQPSGSLAMEGVPTYQSNSPPGLTVQTDGNRFAIWSGQLTSGEQTLT